MEERLVIVGRFIGGGTYSNYSDNNIILAPTGICRCVDAHRGKGSPPIVIVRRKEERCGKEEPR